MDFVGRYEQLDCDGKRVCRKLGVKHDVQLPCDNLLSCHQHYYTYYGCRERMGIARMYASDLRLFGYDWLS